MSRLQAKNRSHATQASQATAREPGDLIICVLRALAHYHDDGPRVTVLTDSAAARTVLFAFKAGQQLKAHQISSQILMRALRGHIVFSAAGSSVPARSGMLLRVEANVRHSSVARTANLFVLVEPLAGWRHVAPIAHRTQQDCALQLRWLADEAYPAAQDIGLV